MKTVYEITRVPSNEGRGMIISIRDKGGNIPSSQNEGKERWKEYFQ